MTFRSDAGSSIQPELGSRISRVSAFSNARDDLSSGALVRVRFRLYDLIMIVRLALVPLSFCLLLAVSARSVAAQEEPVPESPILSEMNRQFAGGGDASAASAYTPAALPSSATSSAIFRDIPSISGRYSVGGRTVMPYLGAGFGGGYTSELNRSLTGPSPAQPDAGLRSQFGQGFSPNEFQMGLRIPF